MALKKTNVVDNILMEKDTNRMVLYLFISEPWVDSDDDHKMRDLLLEKANNYTTFLQSKDFEGLMKQHKSPEYVVQLACFDLPSSLIEFLNVLVTRLNEKGYSWAKPCRMSDLHNTGWHPSLA